MDQEPPKLLGVEFHVRGVEGDGVRGDGLPAVPRHKDVAVAGVGKGIVAVLVRVVDHTDTEKGESSLIGNETSRSIIRNAHSRQYFSRQQMAMR